MEWLQVKSFMIASAIYLTLCFYLSHIRKLVLINESVSRTKCYEDNFLSFSLSVHNVDIRWLSPYPEIFVRKRHIHNAIRMNFSERRNRRNCWLLSSRWFFQFVYWVDLFIYLFFCQFVEIYFVHFVFVRIHSFIHS